jgi:2'-5' RNA ligase
VSEARLFVAVWPPPEVLDILAALPRAEQPGVRWTTRGQWHVTLRFLGRADTVAVGEALQRITAVPCEAVLGPRPTRLGREAVALPVAGLEEVAADVTRLTAALGRPPEHRAFRGHLTLARLKGAATGLTDMIVSARWTVSSVALVESHLHPAGARYTTVAEVALKAGRG